MPPSTVSAVLTGRPVRLPAVARPLNRGVRPVLLTDSGVPLGYTIVPANEHDFEPLADLLTGTPS